MPKSETFLDRAIAAGHAELTGEGKQQRIRYATADRSERFTDPEEQVRAEFWAELIYRYGYEPECIGVEVTVPRRTPADRADIVVFRDREQKRPFAVIECKRDGVTDAEFTQAIEQACGNRASLGAPYAGVVAGRTRRWLEFTGETPPREYGELCKLIFVKISDEQAPRKKGEPYDFRIWEQARAESGASL